MSEVWCLLPPATKRSVKFLVCSNFAGGYGPPFFKSIVRSVLRALRHCSVDRPVAPFCLGSLGTAFVGRAVARLIYIAHFVPGSL